jgi:hypothetical protein
LKTLIFGFISIIGGLMLTFGEIRRLFTHTTEAVLENVWDLIRGSAFKFTFGLLMLYAGALATFLHFTGYTLQIQFEFPFVHPSEEAANFYFCFGVGAAIWVLACFLTSATTEGDVFPEWLSTAFYRFVQGSLWILWVAVAAVICFHLGGNRAGDVIGGIAWLFAALEIHYGKAGGFSAYGSASQNGVQTSEWSMSTWWVLDLEERPVLYVMAVLVTLAIAALFPMAQ